MTSVVTTVAELYGLVHKQMREVVEGLDDEALNWSPGPEMNSVAVLVTHMLGSELDTLNLVRGITAERDRDAEFTISNATGDELAAMIDRADVVLAEHAGEIAESDLDAMRERPGRAPQTGIYWLLFNYGHAREHLGHLHMAAQLWRARS